MRLSIGSLVRSVRVSLAASGLIAVSSDGAFAQERTTPTNSTTQTAAVGVGIPQLRKQGTATQLIVDGKPFLILGGELGNSTASSNLQMRSAWPKLKALNVNTALAPVYWELIEPSEGKYNFSSVDSLLTAARTNQMKLVLLWFGTWKNSMSTYVPEYIKTNQAKYTRTESTKGQGQDILAPYVEATVAADARVFAALMAHIKTIDLREHTVLMVQVENETGMIPTARDHSALADSLFAQVVPGTLMTYLQEHKATLQSGLRGQWDAAGGKTSGSWEAVFGSGVRTDELFMAWHFARFHERVTSAGKKAYPIPMYANAALIRPGYLPGRYVSAGPLPHLADVWRAASPSTDFLAPDIYFPNFTEWTDRYAGLGTTFFVPEAISTPQMAANAFYAIGKHSAIGFSPFSIENVEAAKSPLTKSYALMREITPLILAHQGLGTMTGVMPVTAFDGSVDASPQTVKLNGAKYTLNVSFAEPPGPVSPSPGMPGADGPVTPAGVAAAAAVAQRNAPPRGGIIIALSPDEFLVAGTGLVITFAPTDGVGFAGIMRAQEGHYARGVWQGGRWMNGDQTHQGRHLAIYLNEYGMQRIKLYTYR